MIQVWYHANCTDGFGAAWAAHSFFEKKGIKKDEDVKYIPLNYEDPMPYCNYGDIVHMLDYCRKPDELVKLLDNGVTICLLDHHKSALDYVNNLPGEYRTHINFHHVLDMTRSGAMITWKYFFGDVQPPRLLVHIQDRDLWKHEYPSTGAVIMGLFNEDFDFDRWDEYANNDAEFEDLIQQGDQLLEYRKRQVRENAKNAYLIDIPQHGLVGIPVVNTLPELRSDVCHELLQIYPNAAIAIAWFTRGKLMQLSLRSRGEVDVCALAKMYGGGGHHNAAGFEEPFQTARMLTNNNQVLNLGQFYVMSSPVRNSEES